MEGVPAFRNAFVELKDEASHVGHGSEFLGFDEPFAL